MLKSIHINIFSQLFLGFDYYLLYLCVTKLKNSNNYGKRNKT